MRACAFLTLQAAFLAISAIRSLKITLYMDYFPRSMYAESIALLSKLKSNKLKHINVELEMDELDLTAAESKAT